MGAWQARFQNVHMPEAVAASTRLRGMTMVLGGQTALVLSAQLVVLVTGLVVTAWTNPHPDSLLHCVAILPILLGYIALGALAGTAFPFVATAPTVALMSYVLASSSVGLLPTALTRFGGATADPTGLESRISFDVGHAVFGLGLVLLAVGAGVWLVRRRRPGAVTLGVGVVGLAATVASFAYFRGTDLDRFSSRPVHPACSGTRGLTLCVADTERYQLGPVSKELVKVLAVETSARVTGLPARFNAAVGSKLSPYRPNSAERPLDIADLASANGEVARLTVLMRTVIVDARCIDRSMNSDLSRATADLDLAADLIIERLSPSRAIEAVPGMHSLLAQSQSGQDGWLRDVLVAANACDLQGMPAPPPS